MILNKRLFVHISARRFVREWRVFSGVQAVGDAIREVKSEVEVVSGRRTGIQRGKGGGKGGAANQLKMTLISFSLFLPTSHFLSSPSLFSLVRSPFSRSLFFPCFPSLLFPFPFSLSTSGHIPLLLLLL